MDLERSNLKPQSEYSAVLLQYWELAPISFLL